MERTPMPEPLRRAVHQLVAEAVANCQEVLRYTEPDVGYDWRRMTLYRATDGADTLDMASLLIAAYLEQEGMNSEGVSGYLQITQQKSRAAGPQDSDRAHLSGLFGGPAPEGDAELGMEFGLGQRRAAVAQVPEDDPQQVWTQACLHGLRARLCDDVAALDSYLPPQMAAMARKVADALETSQPAAV
jgi:hypothetical protein